MSKRTVSIVLEFAVSEFLKVVGLGRAEAIEVLRAWFPSMTQRALEMTSQALVGEEREKIKVRFGILANLLRELLPKELMTRFRSMEDREDLFSDHHKNGACYYIVVVLIVGVCGFVLVGWRCFGPISVCQNPNNDQILKIMKI